MGLDPAMLAEGARRVSGARLAADAARAGPGGPSTGARERSSRPRLEVLKADGYAGLTIAKVAARAGEYKALIAYHFGSKQGLVAAAGGGGRDDHREVLGDDRGARRRSRRSSAASLDGHRGVLDRDERIARVYFDLARSRSSSPRSATITEVNDGWRAVLGACSREPTTGPLLAATAACRRC